MIAILARAPHKGRCKTRLIPRLGAAGAARLQGALCLRMGRLALSRGEKVTIWCTPDHRHPVFLALRREGCRLRRQPAGDLGRKMRIAARTALSDDDGVAIFGTDCPAMTAAAIERLASHSLAAIPAPDGGYVALRLDQAEARLFASIRWGSDRVWRSTQRNLRRLGRSYTALAPMADLDEPRDWVGQRRNGTLDALGCCKRH